MQSRTYKSPEKFLLPAKERLEKYGPKYKPTMRPGEREGDIVTFSDKTKYRVSKKGTYRRVENNEEK